ncbi:MAG TPA: hypothetical protein VGG68_00935 [Caulobacteraceae bacterium]|jgi:hypothetical protein
MTGPRVIERLYAWIVTEADGGQGIPAFDRGDGLMLPMIGADSERIESLRPVAMRVAGVCLKLELIEFSGRVVLETHDSPELNS